jgi:serine/threonine protein kinase
MDSQFYNRPQRFMREARVWVNLRHPNVLSFIGLFDIGAPIPILVSQFCEFGHVGEYLTSHVDANRNHLVVSSSMISLISGEC